LRIADNPAAFRDIVQSLINALPNVKDQQTTLNRVLAVGAAGHVGYPTTPPPSNPQNGKRSDEIAVNHLNELGSTYLAGASTSSPPQGIYLNPTQNSTIFEVRPGEQYHGSARVRGDADNVHRWQRQDRDALVEQRSTVGRRHRGNHRAQQRALAHHTVDAVRRTSHRAGKRARYAGLHHRR
jgi:hypothetical protein